MSETKLGKSKSNIIRQVSFKHTSKPQKTTLYSDSISNQHYILCFL